MLIEFHLSQTINVDVGRVFSFLSDFTNMPLWNYYIQDAAKVTDGPVGEGSVFSLKRPRDNYHFKLITYKPNIQLLFELQPPGPPMQYGFSLAPSGQFTNVTLRWEVRIDNYSALKFLPGFIKTPVLKFIEKQILTKTKPAVEQNFLTLKQLLETGEVMLQSGKVVKL